MSSGRPDAAAFREVMALFPTGVVAVTAQGDDGPTGLTIGSFFSVSIHPCLIGFCVNRSSRTWQRMRKSVRLCVNVLAEDQHRVSRILAHQVDPEGFALVSWPANGAGIPAVAGALAWIACDVVDLHDAGTHSVVIAAVGDLAIVRSGGPLVHCQRRYHSITPIVAPTS
ncbi:flavin reductase family protein [Micromonospora peucetia]|uniref:Flavin reductase family protein n=1 Tax=Micromonospora peucetia TaxID=47871 RepID=A0A1C6W4S9_9ACTN|nr:flavin reductase family protein [Micromonospora peucetia]MCX4390027.1 flavin reductase family protein [Micromonospora peucetia]WSA32670.1 flavin reductase family protein [Micromonospora peucetia]SCL73526.1 NADH-FMN oxidoreductase RutF, flavin reductase (DIM6/NTAB) family [Micromonospora peucetia]